MATDGFVTSAELARVLDITGTRIRQLVRDGVLKASKTPSGALRYELIPSIHKYVGFLREAAEKKGKTDDVKAIELETAKANNRLKQAKAKRAEMELAEIEGKMHRSEDVRDVMTDLVFAVRGAMLSIPGRVAMDCAATDNAAEVARIIRETVDEQLTDLTRYEYNAARFAEKVRERSSLGEGVADDE